MRRHLVPEFLGYAGTPSATLIMSSRPARSPLAHRLLYPSIRMLARILATVGWRVKITGLANVPRTGALIIAPNHQSYADPPLVGAFMPREVHFLAKQELFRFGPFGWFIRNLNAHPLNRAGDIAAFREAARILKSGGALIMFPEGRRMPRGQFGAPKAGVGALASMTKTPILPVYVHNSAYMTRFRRVSIHFGPPVEPATFSSYEELAGEVMRRIRDLKDQVIAGRKAI